MSATEKTPLWLDLRKEYIDDNFEKFQTYLKDCSPQSTKDSFYSTTINLFRERIEDLLNTLSVQLIYEEEEDRHQLTFNVKLLASYLLVDGSIRFRCQPILPFLDICVSLTLACLITS